MLIRFSSIFTKVTADQALRARFDGCEKLKSLSSYIELLRKKVNEWESLTEFESLLARNIVQQKIALFSPAVAKFDHQINVFSNKLKDEPVGSEAEKIAICYFIENAIQAMFELQNDPNVMVLNSLRDNKRQNVNQAVHYGLLGGAAVATIPILGFGLGFLASEIGAFIGSGKIRDTAGLTSRDPSSKQILFNLCSCLSALRGDFNSKAVVEREELRRQSIPPALPSYFERLLRS